jgi:hypothetical protein
MGYHTEFWGRFDLDCPLVHETYRLLKGLSETRRMKRSVEGYGIDGEFFIPVPDGNFGQTHDENIVDYNAPPATQPGLWCQWIPTEDRLHIEWDGGEKFYEYVPWIRYLLNRILLPRGYKLTGSVEWQGEETDDKGIIVAEGNRILSAFAQPTTYQELKEEVD